MFRGSLCRAEIPMRCFSTLLLALSLTCTGVLVTACSGAEVQDVLLEPKSGSGQPDDKNNESPGTTSDAGGGGSSDDPIGTCAPEEEPNDDEKEANKLAPSRCGTLSNDDQKDFLTFRLKSTTTRVSITLTGKIRLRVSVKGGDTVELTPDQTSDIPFVMDEDYFIEVTALSTARGTVNWRVAIVEE